MSKGEIETGTKWFDINFVTKCLWLSRLEFIVRKIKMYAWSSRVLVSLRSVQEKLLGSGRTYRVRTYVRSLKQRTSFGQDVRTQLGRSYVQVVSRRVFVWRRTYRVRAFVRHVRQQAYFCVATFERHIDVRTSKVGLHCFGPFS